MYKLSMIVFFVASICEGKEFGRCELALELVNNQGFDKTTIGDWICLAFYSSKFNSESVYENVDGSIDYGLFQINDNYWCDEEIGYGAECNIACKKFLDSDIADDSVCARMIWQIHGFDVWYGWHNYCKDTNVEFWVDDCFGKLD